jgi:hypothetical protein
VKVCRDSYTNENHGREPLPLYAVVARIGSILSHVLDLPDAAAFSYMGGLMHVPHRLLTRSTCKQKDSQNCPRLKLLPKPKQSRARQNVSETWRSENKLRKGDAVFYSWF